MENTVKIAAEASEKIEKILFDALAAGVSWNQVNRLVDKANRQAKYKQVIDLKQKQFTDKEIAEKVKVGTTTIGSITTYFWAEKMKNKTDD